MRFAQTPVASHRFEPLQVSGSSALFTDVQVPVVHDKQEPVQLVLQQCPSAQLPEVHCAFVAHTAPLANGLATHTPAALHVLTPVHVSASSALFTAVHVPVV